VARLGHLRSLLHIRPADALASAHEENQPGRAHGQHRECVMTIKNHRPLDAIAADIHKLERNNVFAIGDLLLEAQEGECEYGEWGDWIEENFDWSQDTAENYMNAARLGDRFRKIRNLRLAKTTIYALAKNPDAPLLPAIVEALAKAAAKKQLKPAEAHWVILLVKLRHEHGDLPDATLLTLDDISYGHHGAWFDATVAALKDKKPTTEEAAKKIVEDIRRAHVEGDEPEDADDDEAEDTDDGTNEETDDDTDEPEDTDDDEPDDPAASVDAMKANKAEARKLIRAWVNATADAKRALVQERWDEIESLRRQLDANGKADRRSDSETYTRG
jgi:hypothetical protein